MEKNLDIQLNSPDLRWAKLAESIMGDWAVSGQFPREKSVQELTHSFNLAVIHRSMASVCFKYYNS